MKSKKKGYIFLSVGLITISMIIGLGTHNYSKILDDRTRYISRMHFGGNEIEVIGIKHNGLEQRIKTSEGTYYDIFLDELDKNVYKSTIQQIKADQ